MEDDDKRLSPITPPHRPPCLPHFSPLSSSTTSSPSTPASSSTFSSLCFPASPSTPFRRSVAEIASSQTNLFSCFSSLLENSPNSLSSPFPISPGSPPVLDDISPEVITNSSVHITTVDHLPSRGPRLPRFAPLLPLRRGITFSDRSVNIKDWLIEHPTYYFPYIALLSLAVVAGLTRSPWSYLCCAVASFLAFLCAYKHISVRRHSIVSGSHRRFRPKLTGNSLMVFLSLFLRHVYKIESTKLLWIQISCAVYIFTLFQIVRPQQDFGIVNNFIRLPLATAYGLFGFDWNTLWVMLGVLGLTGFHTYLG